MTLARSAEPTWTVHTDVFEGPLDLLLYLIERDGIDLKQLPVARIAVAYLEWIERMRELDLRVAGEWLVMAATLVHLKSLELLPKPPRLIEEGHEEDPREAFARRLRDHARYKRAAEGLNAREQVNRDVFVRAPAELPSVERPLVAGIDAFGLLDRYHALLKGGGEPTVDLSESGPDFASCCTRILSALGGKGGRTELAPLLESLRIRAARVVTFVGVLEMARLGWLVVQQDQHLGPVHLEQRVSDEAIDMRLLTGRLEEVAP